MINLLNKLEIKIDDLTGHEIADLLAEHHQDMLTHSPPESVHALQLESLRLPNIYFWCAWVDGQLAGCGALKEIDKTHAEIKSMRTSRAFLRQGVAAKLLVYMIEQAYTRGYQKLSLETGSMQAFAPARKLYQQFGFKECKPFADYVDDPYSVFMTKKI